VGKIISFGDFLWRGEFNQKLRTAHAGSPARFWAETRPAMADTVSKNFILDNGISRICFVSIKLSN
jgi:hypothetical protein